MPELLTLQDLANGHLDVKALGEAANGDENTIVTTRTGNTYPSAERAINIMFQNGGLPAVPFKTKALMTASALVDGDYAVVTEDTARNNGLYIREGGNWAKSKYNGASIEELYIYKSNVSQEVTALSSVLRMGAYYVTSSQMAAMTDAPSGMPSSAWFLLVERYGDFVRQTLERTSLVSTASTKVERVIIDTTSGSGTPVSISSWRTANPVNPHKGVVDVSKVPISSLSADGTYLLTYIDNASDGADWLPNNAFMRVSSYGTFVRQEVYNGIDFGDPAYSVRYLRPSRDEAFDWYKIGSGESANVFANKRIVFLGDSVTDRGDYPSRVGSRLGLAGAVNGGFGGARLTEQFDAQSGLTGVDMADSIESGDWSVQIASANAGGGKIARVNALAAVDWLETDYLILFYGTNDHSANVPLGEITENNRTTVNGAMNYINTKIITKYPHLKILWLTPMYRSNYATNTLGNTLLQIVDVIIERAQAYNQPVFDLYRESGVNSINVSHYYSDAVHPNSTGYAHLANKVAAKLSAIF